MRTALKRDETEAVETTVSSRIIISVLSTVCCFPWETIVLLNFVVEMGGRSH
jgi:hypothetical protein